MALYPAHLLPALAQPPLAAVSRRGVLASFAATAAGPLLLAGCDGGSTGRPRRTFDEVTYITAVGTAGREAFAWVANELGFFADEGLKVKIVPGAVGDENLKMLAAGRADFVQIDYSGAVVRAGKGSFDQFRAVSVLNNKTIIAIMALTSSGIHTPKDLVGKTVAQIKGSVVQTLFPAYARLAGIDEKSVTWHEVSKEVLPSLLIAGQADGIGQFIPGEPGIRAASKGQPITVLPYSEYMSDLYGNVLVTRADTHVDLSRRFVRALHKGLRHAVDNPDQAGTILHDAVPTVKPDVAAAELTLLKPYVGAPQADSVLVARSMALLQSIGLYPQGLIDAGRVFDFHVMGDAAGNTVNGGSR